MEYRSEVNVSESETEEETVFPPINIGYAALSPYCDISSASRKVSLERSSFNEELELESDPEDMEDECPCDLHVIVMRPAPCVPFTETCYSRHLRSLRKTAHDGHCLGPPTVSYLLRQIKNFCFSLCKKIEISPGFWMIQTV